MAQKERKHNKGGRNNAENEGISTAISRHPMTGGRMGVGTMRCDPTFLLFENHWRRIQMNVKIFPT